ncbi:hypothetical protein D5S17_27810 [Pseudonocardiaceae bacterium YIM PH 21723]|nr:hypothetical protein D5S17_27810 [Pseudonocardiaceae bacterium YIM PH 21723]
MPRRSSLLALACALVLIAGSMLSAQAASGSHEVVGLKTPAQPYKGNPDSYDWLGAYEVGGKQVWCVQFAYAAPGTGEGYPSTGALTDKWGTPLAPEVAADISYLLLRYNDTSNPNDAAALAHLLHTWTAGTTDPAKLGADKSFQQVGYDVNFHLNSLPAEAKQAVDRLKAEAIANRGPWQITVAAPADPQLIDAAGTWTVAVTAGGKPQGGARVTLTATDATVENAQVSTPADGSPLVVKVTPTGPNPTLSAKTASPVPVPTVKVPANQSTQKILTTGGETEINGTATTTAKHAPGKVKISKADASSGTGIAKTSLRVTAADKKGPANKQDGTPLNGPDGTPLVLVTGADGTVLVPDLATPQEVCVVETQPAPGYEEAFDAAAPAAACGTLKPGETLTLALTNKPNKPKVPIVIPAGDGSTRIGS